MFEFLWSCMWLSIQVSIGGFCWFIFIIAGFLILTLCGFGGAFSIDWLRERFKKNDPE